MRKEKKSILTALALGDGFIRLNKEGMKRRTGQLCLLHSTAQIAYLEWKRDLLHSLLGGSESKISTRSVLNKGNGKTYERAELNKSHRYFAVLHKWLYPQGKKTIARNMLNKLDPQGLAIWYMDDGNLKVNRATTDRFKTKPKGSITSLQLVLATYVSEEEADVINDYFKEVWGIVWIKQFNERSGKWFHRANTKEGKKFLDLISPHVIPSMHYKILTSQERPVPIERERVKNASRERYSLNCLETYRSCE